MFNTISWRQYMTAIVTLGSLYYLVIILIYYRKDILQLFRTGLGTKKAVLPAGAGMKDAGLEKAIPGYEALQELTNEISLLVINAAGKSYPREELIMALQVMLRQHDSLNKIPYREAVNNYIAAECRNQCQVDLNEMELQQLW